MARYTGPKNRINRKFAEPILGSGKNLDKNSFPPGMHGNSKKRKTTSEYSLQLREKQKAKYTYLMLEKQFRNTYFEANRQKGSTGENLMKLLESRLDNTVFRMGFTGTRTAARQLVSHNHLLVNGQPVNVPSYSLKPGDVIELKPKSKANNDITGLARPKAQRIGWVDFNEKEFKGTFLMAPERESIPENIKEQLIVELYSK
ncbi:MAG: 30S ribosomal protein S4 [Bacteroidetes bacterium]|nr:30S ribosomal protein S4 [Bacteroidota bacterium]